MMNFLCFSSDTEELDKEEAWKKQAETMVSGLDKQCVIIFGTFLCRPLQNNSVEGPNSALSEEHERQRLIF